MGRYTITAGGLPAKERCTTYYVSIALCNNKTCEAGYRVKRTAHVLKSTLCLELNGVGEFVSYLELILKLWRRRAR